MDDSEEMSLVKSLCYCMIQFDGVDDSDRHKHRKNQNQKGGRDGDFIVLGIN